MITHNFRLSHLYSFFVLFHFSLLSPRSFFRFFFVSQITLWYKILMQKLCSPRTRQTTKPNKKNRKVRMGNVKSRVELNEKWNFFWLLLSWQRNTNDKFWKFCLAACFACHLYFFSLSPLIQTLKVFRLLFPTLTVATCYDETKIFSNFISGWALVVHLYILFITPLGDLPASSPFYTLMLPLLLDVVVVVNRNEKGGSWPLTNWTEQILKIFLLL